jgi:hypothetical protein
MKFIMEIKEIKQRKTPSNDNEFSIKLVTDDKNLMALAAIPSEQLVEVEFRGEK